ncbi:hypothetical protein BX616_000689 [Lobosporangium transversale]|nr:hypothetical protein BX616_000689 [Lobosporangium transversale]
MGYQKPYFILYISHSFWAIALPLQFIYSTYLSPGAPGSHLTLQERISYFAKLVRHSTHDLYHRKSEYILVGQATVTDPTIPSSTPFSHAGQEAKSLWKYLFYVTFGMTILFMVPSYLWYSCVAMTSMANLTAIYNTACFFAYLFSVVLLNEKIVVNKVIAVILSLLGVAIISLTVEDTTVPDDQGKKHSTVALVGDFLALIGAALYGFEEVHS